jgi:hypothetical protein
MPGQAGVRNCGAVGWGALARGFACIVLVAAAQGCSGPTTLSAPPSSVSTSLQPVATMTRPADTVQLFAEVAAELAPRAVYAPTSLPDGAVLAGAWAPVIASTDPGSYGGPQRSNPYVVGSGADAEVQVVYRVGTGWLVIIENFHGDLGDVAGESIGTVGGNPANLFPVNGGELVQWSENGCWYGVFGRGLSRGVILAAALGMKVER